MISKCFEKCCAHFESLFSRFLSVSKRQISIPTCSEASDIDFKGSEKGLRELGVQDGRGEQGEGERRRAGEYLTAVVETESDHLSAARIAEKMSSLESHPSRQSSQGRCKSGVFFASFFASQK